MSSYPLRPREILSNVVDGLRSGGVLLNHQTILELLSIY